jgi:hypothetical protein
MRSRLSGVLGVVLGLAVSRAAATPSTQIWIPSTDIQAFGTVHGGIDNYFTIFTKAADGAYAFPTDIGLTVGVAPFVELGFDWFEPSDYPLMFNLKAGVGEDRLPVALAAGVFGVGTEPGVTNYNMVYGLVAKTLAPVGRISLGYYVGNDRVLVNADGNADNAGLLASWDRAMPEISDKLWMAVDYQGGTNAFGAVGMGFSWAFSEKVSVLVGYVVYALPDTAGTLTTQLDVNF